MSAYMVVLDTEVRDHRKAEDLALRIGELVEASGGKYLIRGAPTQGLGPEAAPVNIIVSEFESIEDLNAAFAQDDVVKLRLERRACVESTAFIVEGL